jgi:hypothetical protein
MTSEKIDNGRIGMLALHNGSKQQSSDERIVSA